MNEPAIIHTDGACSGNPGPGGFAAIIEVGDDRITVTGGHPATTNNRMEIAAVIEALRLINSQQPLRHSHVTIRSDSQYIVKAFNDRWIDAWQRNGWRTAKKQPVLNQDLWEALIREIAPHQAEFVWVKGHAGDPMNEECDRLAVAQSNAARSQPTYWTSAGNPLSEVSETGEPVEAASQQSAPAPTPLSILQLAVERNDIVLNTLRRAITLLDGGHQKPVTAQLRTTIRHLEAQRELLTDDGDPGQQSAKRTLFQTSPLNVEMATEQNARAFNAVHRTISLISDGIPTANVTGGITQALSILEEQHNVLTNAAKGFPTFPDASTDTQALLDDMEAAMANALYSMKNDRPWEVADQLEAALRKLGDHRRSKTQAASGTPEPAQLPMDDLPF